MQTKKRTKSCFTKQDVITRISGIVAQRYKNTRRLVEVGLRTNQPEHVFAECPTRKAYSDFYESTRSDLYTFFRLKTTEIDPDVLQFGSVVHVYVSTWQWGDWDLDDVLTIWLGTETESPVLLDGGD